MVSFVCGVNKATPPTLFRITLSEVILNPNLLSCLSPHLKDDTFSRGLSYMKSDSDELLFLLYNCIQVGSNPMELQVK